MKKRYPLTKKERDPKYTQQQEWAVRSLSGLPEETVVVITGAQGALAQEYLKTFSDIAQDKKRVIGLHRRDLTGEKLVSEDDVTYLEVDFNNKGSLEKALSEMHLNEYKRIIVIHTVGKFKPELDGKPEIDNDGDGIDDEVRESNVELTKRIIETIDEKMTELRKQGKQLSCEFVAFGSIVENEYEKHPSELQHLRSFCIAKREMEKYLREVNEQKPYIQTTVFRLPTLDTEQERGLRPYAEHTKDWLEPKIITSHTLPEIISRSNRRIEKDEWEDAEYLEVDVYPRLHLTDEQKQEYIREHLNRWQRETGYEAEREREVTLPELKIMKK
ncbi:MAG: hypothetical protein WC659_01095 [Patescibacteria group bacterium]